MIILKITLVLTSFLFLYGGTVFGFTTNNTSSTRTFNKNEAARGQSIAVTVTFTNNEASSLRGFYYAEQIPEGLVVNTTSVKINGNTVSNYIFESGSVGDVYPGNVVYRWILETPTSFSENHPIPSGSNVQIVYSVSSIQPRAFHLDEFNWVGYYQGGSKAAFGHSENVDKKTIRFFKVDADFDGDGITDVAAFHLPSDQFFTDYAGNMGQYGWGGLDSYPLVWDYEGNGSTDISIYHIPTNQWFVKGYPGDNLGAFGWGQDQSVPVPGDYDGDGVIDRAFYHWPTNRWFVEGAGGSFTAYDFGWGGADCIPIALDYDGNGTTDMMLYHIPTNQWFVYGIGNLGQFGWNGSECIPVPGDWDGDGEIDLAVYHWPSNEWVWRDKSGTPHFLGQYGWGGMASFPIPGDYNSDGIMERAFYRPSENRWFIEGESDFVWGWDTSNFMPITSQMAIYNWFRFVLGWFQ